MAPRKPLFNKILIANDSLIGMDVALGKAATIEHYSGAAIELAEVIYDTIAEEPPNVLSAEQKATLIEALKAAERNGLRQLLEPYRALVAESEARVLWSKNPTTGILEEVGDVDLLIKPISRRSLIDRLHAPLDWALMRSAPCPVMISKQPWSDSRLVVAAVDAADESHKSLNMAILATSSDLADILGCPLHVMCAYPGLGQSVNELQVAMDYDGIKEDMRATRARLLDSLVEQSAAEVAEIHLLEGGAKDAIPRLSNELGATLTVLGTAARRGLSQLLIGNTAEAIIGAVDGDIVTVREK